jgi:hypothetical protein
MQSDSACTAPAATAATNSPARRPPWPARSLLSPIARLAWGTITTLPSFSHGLSKTTESHLGQHAR